MQHDLEWTSIIDSAHVTNEAMNFEGDFAYTGSTIQRSARDPVTGFKFTSEPPNPATPQQRAAKRCAKC